MRAYVLRRLLSVLWVLLGVTVVTFVCARVIPSDPAARWVGPRATAEQVARARQELGLDRPLPHQLAAYLAGLARGDWGRSIVTHQPVLADIRAYLPPTLELVGAGTALALALGIPLGVAGARARGRWPDHLSRLLAVAAASLPTFWVAMVLQLAFGQRLGWLPLAGRADTVLALTRPVPERTGARTLDALLAGDPVALADALAHLILPALTLAAYPLGLVARMVRSSLLDVLREDYVRTARAYGLPERVVLYRHALRNALGPALTVTALSAAYALTGTFLVESVFAWPGLGRYAATAVLAADFPAIVGVALVVSLAYVLLNLAVDLLQAWLDPRIRYD